MTMTLNEAAKSCRKAKGTVLKAIKEGRLSAPKDTQGRYEIDPSVVSRMLWKFPGGMLRACEGSCSQAARSRGIGWMG